MAGLLVLYPLGFLLLVALDAGNPQARPPTEYGLETSPGCSLPQIILNTLTSRSPRP